VPIGWRRNRPTSLDRLARFTREAQTLAALNHPNIAHIHGLEESDGVRALIMELIEGEDLSQRIARGPIPIRVVTDYGAPAAPPDGSLR
jgi:serine/threonine protein kinase